MSITRSDASSLEGPVAETGVIGPNAVTRVAEALTQAFGAGVCREIFLAAGVERHLSDPPREMVDESDVARLHRAMVERLGPTEAGNASRLAGRLTGDYLLAHRIPALAQILLGVLPRPLAARILVAAIARHAWTFAGSGAFSFSFSPKLQLRIARSPICRRLRTEGPACHYFAAAFERVFGAMLGPCVRVIEVDCEACGAPACRFDVSW